VWCLVKLYFTLPMSALFLKEVVTNCMEQSPSSEDNSRSASQEVPHLL
jgi:hypothetical protein